LPNPFQNATPTYSMAAPSRSLDRIPIFCHNAFFDLSSSLRNCRFFDGSDDFTKLGHLRSVQAQRIFCTCNGLLVWVFVISKIDLVGANHEVHDEVNRIIRSWPGSCIWVETVFFNVIVNRRYNIDQAFLEIGSLDCHRATCFVDWQYILFLSAMVGATKWQEWNEGRTLR